MAIDITDSFVRQFNDVMELVANQRVSKLRSSIKERKTSGKDLAVDRLTNPNSTLGVVASRHADTVVSDLEHSRRTAHLASYARAYMLDTEDQVRMLIDPTSSYVEEIAGEFNRTVDDEIIDSLLGNTFTGETGSTTSALPSAQKIAHGSTALTLAKLKNARSILMANDVDLDREDVFVAVNGEGYEDLLLDTGLVSLDNVNTQANVSGKTPLTIAGFKIIHAERISSYAGSSAASTNRPAIVFARSALTLAMGQDMSTFIDRRPDKNNNWQVLLKSTFGGVRVHDEKVVDIRFQE